MATIIKDLTILNDSNYYLTKQDKVMKNDYNIIGKSYNKKEKFKTQLSNYEISLEYVLNKQDKKYFFNLLNNNNYFLYKNNNSFNSSLIYLNSISYLYINIEEIDNKIDVFKYDINNRLYLLIEDKKYSFKFDENYDYQLNGKYRFIDEISNNITIGVIDSICYHLDLCILLNNSIKFKYLTEEKYNLSFSIETINNIITSLSVTNTINTNNLIIGEYIENFGYEQNILYTKTLKLNEKHYLNICAYSLSKFSDNSSSSTVYNDNFYVTIKYQKIYIKDNNEIIILDEFYSRINMYHEYKNYFINSTNNDIIYVSKEEFLKNVNFNTKLNNNDFYLVYTIAEKERINYSYKEYDNNNNIFTTKQKTKFNILLNTHIEYFKFEIINDKMNIKDYKTYFKKELVKYNIYNVEYTQFSPFNVYFTNNALRTSIYIYNNKFYVTSILSDVIITNTIINENIERINFYNELNFRIYKNIYSSQYLNQSDLNYDCFFRTIIQEENKNDFEILNITKSNIYSFKKNENELLYNFNNELVYNDKVKYFLVNQQYSKTGFNDFATNLSYKSNNKELFIKVYREELMSNYIFTMFDFLKNNFIIKNNLNEYKNIQNISFLNGFNQDDLRTYLLDYKNNIYFYFNTNTNKYNIIYNSASNINDITLKTTLIEFNYDNNNTINISNIKTIDYFYNQSGINYAVNSYFNCIIENNNYIELHQSYYDLILKKNYLKITILDYNYNIINTITKEVNTYY